MKNKSVFGKKILIIISIFMGTWIGLSTMFFVIAGASRMYGWGEYMIGWLFPTIIFILFPVIMGMYNDKDVLFTTKWLLLKLLTSLVIYICVLLMFEWISAEPKQPDMQTYKNMCLIIIPIVLIMCTIGHYIGKRVERR